MNDARIKKAREIVNQWIDGSRDERGVPGYHYGVSAKPGYDALIPLITEVLPEMPKSEDIYLGISMARVEYNKAIDISELDDFHFGFMAGVKWLAKKLGLEESAACAEVHE